MGFSINDIAELAALGDLRFQLQRIAGLVRAVNHDDAIGRGHESMVTTPYLGLCKDVAGQLLHNAPPPVEWRCEQCTLAMAWGQYVYGRQAICLRERDILSRP